MDAQFFVGIGAQKAGTSWLSAYLKSHPEVGFSPLKEIHYFDSVYEPALSGEFDGILLRQMKEAVRRLDAKNTDHESLEFIRCLCLRLEMKQNPDRYRDYFELLSSNGKKAVGEITPAYSLLHERGFAAIGEMYEDAKFIFILRDPSDRLWSQLRFREAKQGKTSPPSSAEALLSLENDGYTLRSDYRRTLVELYKVVPRDRVCILFYENLFDPESHPRELKRLTEFLGIEHRGADLDRLVNASISGELDEPARRVIVRNFTPTYRYIEKQDYPNFPARWRENMQFLEG